MSRRASLIHVLGRSLAAQLDQLRHTLDHLGQRLRAALTHAVGETVGATVRRTLHAMLADDPSREKFDHPSEPRYRGPPVWEERRSRSSWGEPSWDAYSGWPGAEEPEELTYSEEVPTPAPESRCGTAAQLLLVSCQALAWWLRRHSSHRPLLAALGIGAACGVAAYVGGPLAIGSVGLAGGALGLATLTDVVRSGAQALTGSNALP